MLLLGLSEILMECKVAVNHFLIMLSWVITYEGGYVLSGLEWFIGLFLSFILRINVRGINKRVNRKREAKYKTNFVALVYSRYIRLLSELPS